MGLPYWSLSQYLKHQVKNAVNFISAFEHVMTEEARRRECDGVVCGHINKAEIREINGILYANDGDWVASPQWPRTLKATCRLFTGIVG